MDILVKKIVFGLLFGLFIVFTICVDTVGTSYDKGASSLTVSTRHGKVLFQHYNCTACHQLYGLGGYMGPDLTNEMSAPSRGEKYARVLLSHGSGKMPDFHLSGGEIEDLIAYLKYVDRTGVSPVREFDIHYDGTVSSKQ